MARPDRESLAADVQAFLERGGDITAVPDGATALPLGGALSSHRTADTLSDTAARAAASRSRGARRSAMQRPRRAR